MSVNEAAETSHVIHYRKILKPPPCAGCSAELTTWGYGNLFFFLSQAVPPMEKWRGNVRLGKTLHRACPAKRGANDDAIKVP